MEIAVLGPISVTDASMETIDVGGPRQRRLLTALVAHANDRVSTDELIEIVFEGDPSAAASTTIRSYVARLRKTLAAASHGGEPARIVSVPSGYRLDIDPTAIDAARFSSMAATGRSQIEHQLPVDAIDTLRGALALWHGPAYGEFAHEEWARGEAARLEELHVEAQVQLVDAQLRCGMHHEVIPDLRGLVAAHPLREDLRGQLMLALHRAGRQVEALRTFDDHRRELIEVGLEPTGVLVTLERSIAAHDPALQLATPAGTALRGYRLGSSLGVGRQGEVFRAVQPVIGREVAIKVIRPELADDPSFIQRFDTEARMISQLEHAHIVPLHDFWREPNAAYMVMRLLPNNLRHRLDEGGLSIDQTGTLVRQLGSALTAAHCAGLVHGDLRPSNVLIDSDLDFYLSDFGVSGLHLRTAQVEPPEGHALLAPEVRAGLPPTHLTDQYGLAVLTAYALTGVLPFGRLGRRAECDLLPSIHTQRPNVPLAVDEVLQRGAAWEPADRFATVDELVAALLSALTGTSVPVTSGPVVNPFRGLEPFTEADAAWFFGRDEAIDDVLRRLAAPGMRMVTVIGASGSGKSSLARAGVVPKLGAGAVPGSDRWLITSMTPGAHPLAALRSALRSIARSDSPRLLEPSITDMVSTCVDDDGHVLLVLDQLEELYTLADEADRRAFVEGLTAALADERCRLRVLATMRADYHDRPLHHSRFGRLVAGGAVTLVGMGAGDLDRAIREPLARVGVEIDPAVVTEIVAELVDRPVALPLMQFTLTELFERCRGDVITMAAYRELGGVQGALARRADEVYDGLDAASRGAARHLFLRLVAVDDQTVSARRRVPSRELVDQHAIDPNECLRAFGAARLLAFDRDPSTREPTVELAHEALLTEWPRLRQWVVEAGDGLRLRNRLTASAALWESNRRDEGDLYRGARLHEAVSWQRDDERRLTRSESDFIAASVAAHEAAEANEQRHHDEQARAHRRLRGLAVTVAVALVVAVVAGFVAIGQRDRARHDAARADLEAERRAVEAWAATLAELLGAGQIVDVAIADDRGLAAAASLDGTVVVRRADDDAVAVLVVGLTAVTSIAVHPHLDQVAVGGSDGAVRIWDVATEREVGRLRADDPVVDIAYAADGRTLTTFGPNGRPTVHPVN